MIILDTKNCKVIKDINELVINDSTVYLEFDSFVEGCGAMCGVSRLSGNEVRTYITDCLKNNDLVSVCEDDILYISNRSATFKSLLMPAEFVSKFLIGAAKNNEEN